MSAQELLLAYKQQPMIEKRFAQLKTDFVVAPVYLKEVSRIQALLCVYFFALLVESLLERELRRAMEREGIESLPLYPEGRACRRPTARKVIDLFEDVQRHELTAGKRPPGGLQHGADPAATEDPAAPGNAQGLRDLIPTGRLTAAGNSKIFSARCAESREIRHKFRGNVRLFFLDGNPGYWSDRTEIPTRQLIRWIGLSQSKFYDWRKRYGKVNEHNG